MTRIYRIMSFAPLPICTKPDIVERKNMECVSKRLRQVGRVSPLRAALFRGPRVCDPQQRGVPGRVALLGDVLVFGSAAGRRPAVRNGKRTAHAPYHSLRKMSSLQIL